MTVTLIDCSFESNVSVGVSVSGCVSGERSSGGEGCGIYCENVGAVEASS